MSAIVLKWIWHQLTGTILFYNCWKNNDNDINIHINLLLYMLNNDGNVSSEIASTGVVPRFDIKLGFEWVIFVQT